MTSDKTGRTISGTLARAAIASSTLITMVTGQLVWLAPAQAHPSARARLATTKGAGAFSGKQVATGPRTKPFGKVEGSGTLMAMAAIGGHKQLGRCPLKHTSVEANVSGYVSRVTVKQVFANPFKQKIEAVYTFPLSKTGAVDEMLMKVGERTIHGTIKKREEAKKIYQRAKARGHVASLLDQERPNIFTQSVANIEPGKEVEITINYVDLLPYDDGQYSFVFPTVVGPRFNPGKPIGRSGTGRDPDTSRVPDASRISPEVTPEGTRAGHDISISVNIDAGVPVSNINSKLHKIKVSKIDDSKATVKLQNQQTIPNRDFVLSWDVAGSSLKSGYLTFRDEKKNKSGFFTLMLLPPRRPTKAQIAPREMVFLVDCSGSQRGKPIEKAKETLRYVVNRMNPADTFQIVAFNYKRERLFEKPRIANPSTKRRALNFINKLEGRGGTFMTEAVQDVCAMKAPRNRLRIVTFMTDGYFGGDMRILGLVRKYRDRSRWFSFGTGNSVNRFLIDGVAKEGGGEADYVLLNSSAKAVGKKFYKRIASPVLTDVKVSFNGVEVKEVLPKRVSDVWAQKPLYIKGRYLQPGSGTVTLSGFQAGKPYSQTMRINFPAANTTNSGIASVWARAKVDRLMSEDWFGAASGKPNKELKNEIVATALKHHIMTQYTSFVAVEEKTITKGGKATKVSVPVEMPDGVSRDGVFGEKRKIRVPARPMRSRRGLIAKGMRVPSPAPIPVPKASGYSISKRRLGKASWYKAPRQIQIVDKKPFILDYRSAGSSAANSISAADLAALPPASALPPPPTTSRIYSPGGSSNKLQGASTYGGSSSSRSMVRGRLAPGYDRKERKPAAPGKNMASALGKIDSKLRNLQKMSLEKKPVAGVTMVNGRVKIVIFMTSKKDSVLSILKKLGLTDIKAATKDGKTVTGLIAPGKLIELASKSFVVRISPAKG